MYRIYLFHFFLKTKNRKWIVFEGVQLRIKLETGTFLNGDIFNI